MPEAMVSKQFASYRLLTGPTLQRRFAREAKVQEYHLGESLSPSVWCRLHAQSDKLRLSDGRGDTGANIILAHFHYCNKGVAPFSDECEDQDLRTLAHLDEDKIQFVRATRAYIKRHSKYPNITTMSSANQIPGLALIHDCDCQSEIGSKSALGGSTRMTSSS